MINKNILKKAWEIFDKGKIKLLNETDRAIYFQIEKDSIFIKNDNGIKLSCTCKYCTLTQDQKLCSKKIASLIYIATHNDSYPK